MPIDRFESQLLDRTFKYSNQSWVAVFFGKNLQIFWLNAEEGVKTSGDKM